MTAGASGRVRTRRRALVAVIGDARADPRSRTYRMAQGLGESLVNAGFRIVTGGLGGVMEAACRGARRSTKYRPGDTIGLLPSLDPDEANPFVDIAIGTGLGDLRNGLVANADAVIAIGGGAGTLSEIALAWMRRRLIVAMGSDGWAANLMDVRLDHRSRKVETEDDRIFSATTPDEATAIVSRLWQTYRRRPRGWT
ncbi:MAG: TIGR00725 family protein [Planctomycetota bacterium]|nr:TIGR00725 family protein [Planctomycetota bacterium]